MRLDKYIQQKFSLKSRTYAENLILTGRVSLDGRIASKPAEDVDDSRDVRIISDEGYASQGAYKLEEGLRAFDINVEGLACADIGCSNGGFTDVLLRHGAGSVLAVDVGECALPPEILQSGKVTFLRANARALPKDIAKVDFVCSDLSFISLGLVLGELYDLLKEGGQAVVLVKPQFELDRSALSKDGVVKSEKLRRQAVQKVRAYAVQAGFEIAGETESPRRYVGKNVEYLLHLKKRGEKSPSQIE